MTLHPQDQQAVALLTYDAGPWPVIVKVRCQTRRRNGERCNKVGGEVLKTPRGPLYVWRLEGEPQLDLLDFNPEERRNLFWRCGNHFGPVVADALRRSAEEGQLRGVVAVVPVHQ